MLYEKLNYILTIAEEQNLTRAARRLFISQPTLTLYLNRLEAELGVKLFDRSKSPILLTEAGKYYIDEMKKISASEQLLRSDIKRIANPTQTLVIGIGQVRGRHWLPMLLPGFCAIHPDVNIQVVQCTEQYMNEALHRHTIDIAIGALPASVSDLSTVDLTYERLFLAAHCSYGLIPTAIRAQYGPDCPCVIAPHLLNGLPFIIPQVSNGLYDNYETIILDNHIQPSRTISVNNLSTGLRLTMRGLGVQLLTGSILQLDRISPAELAETDFCILENMPETRKCIAAYCPDNIKRKLILDVIRIIQNDVLPNCQYTTRIETK